MASKPRKPFSGVARPQGFIDDAAKALVKGVKKAVTGNKVSSKTRGDMYKKALAAEKRLKTSHTSKRMYGREFDEYDSKVGKGSRPC
jgi:predicted secreted Zn-dependent protease